MNFSLIIPAYNEFHNLQILLPRIQYISDNIIVIDPGTNDGTKSLCDKYSIVWLKQNSKGKGNALLEAVENAKYEVVCFIDADLAHDPSIIKKLVAPILAGDVLHVSGSRMLGGSSELFADADHFIRLLGSLIINYAISFKFGWKMTDCQNGFRALDKKFLKNLKLNSAHTTIEQELVGKTLASGNIVLEIPAHEFSRISGVSKINVFKHGWAYVASLLSILLTKSIPINKIDASQIKNKYSYDWWIEN